MEFFHFRRQPMVNSIFKDMLPWDQRNELLSRWGTLKKHPWQHRNRINQHSQREQISPRFLQFFEPLPWMNCTDYPESQHYIQPQSIQRPSTSTIGSHGHNTVWDPMYPAPPVTRTYFPFFASLDIPFLSAVGIRCNCWSRRILKEWVVVFIWVFFS